MLTQSLQFAKGTSEDNKRLGVRMYKYWKSGDKKTGAVPLGVEMASILGRVKAMVRSRWFWAFIIVLAFAIGLIGQRAGWWNFVLFKWIVGAPGVD